MKKQFDQVHDRIDTASVKWDYVDDIFNGKDLLPMWVADMDFKAPTKVIEALSQTASTGIYGYTGIPNTVTSAITGWLHKRHGWAITQDSIIFTTGVVPAISSIISILTNPGDKILLQSPVYYPFFDMVHKNNRQLINCPLMKQNGKMEMDFDRLEDCFKEGVKLYLLCNPHNPGGRVWTVQELTKLAELCVKYNVYIISDEIHSDLVYTPNKHIPIASLSNEISQLVVTCISPSKTFNLAGLQGAALIIENASLREKIQSYQETQGFFTLNTFAIVGMEAAYRYGEEWLQHLLEYLHDNISFAISFLQEHLPALELIRPESTYLLWISYNKLGLSSKEINRLLIEKGKLALEPGEKFGPGGEGYLRMNIACPRSTLEEGLNRLRNALG